MKTGKKSSALLGKSTLLKTKFLLIGIPLLIMSCKKDTPPIQNYPSTNSINLVNTPGSWWVYDWYGIDGAGQETPKGVSDSLYVIGDTLINGKVYAHIKGTFYGTMQYNSFQRDSSEFLVDQKGNIIFANTENADTTSVRTESPLIIYTLTGNTSSSLTVPAGTFNHLLETKEHFYMIDGSTWSCGESWVMKKYYEQGVGVVMLQCAFYSQLLSDCSYIEMRLVDYYIAP